MNLFELLLFGSLIIWGIYATFQEGMIFEKLGEMLSTLPSVIRKPLGTCPICMPSVYGTIIFWLFFFCHWINYNNVLILYICYIFALSGANYIIKNLLYVEYVHEEK